MNEDKQYTAFAGYNHIVTGDLKAMLCETYKFLNVNKNEQVLIFDNRSGSQIDFNFHGSLEDVLQNALPPEPKKGPGRPRMGVANGEISLLPRHWDWLQMQPKKASGTIRRLVEAAIKNTPPEDIRRQKIEAAGKFMWTIAGNLAEFEEASRALYSAKWLIMDTLTSSWPADVRNHLDFMLLQVKNPFSKSSTFRLEILEPLKNKYSGNADGGEPWRMNMVGLSAAAARGSFTAVEAVESSFRRIKEINSGINGITALFTDEALETAAEIDRKRASGIDAGPLAGVPFTVKGNLDIAGHATTNGIPAMKDTTALVDSPVIRRLKAAGAVAVGHTNLPDMSLRFHTSSSLYGATLNPWNRNFTPGGSSGGEGVSVATGMSAFGVGNDAGGSLRIPALFNGIAALKPGYGRFPSDRSVGPRNTTLASQVIPVDGFLARSVADLHILYQIAAGPDPADPRVVPAPLFFDSSSKPVKVAVVSNPGNTGVDKKVEAVIDYAAEVLAAAGYIVEQAALPHITEITEAYGKMIMTEFYQSLPMLKRLLGPDGQRYIEFAMKVRNPVDLAGYLELTAVRQGFQREWAQFFDNYPLVLGPVFTQDIVPPDYDIQGLDEYREITQALRLCSATSFIGVPAVSVPIGTAAGRPLGVQLIGGMYREDLCLEAAAVIEAAVGVFTPINPR